MSLMYFLCGKVELLIILCT